MKRKRNILLTVVGILILSSIFYLFNEGDSPILEKVALKAIDKKWIELADNSPDLFRKKIIQLASTKNDEVISVAEYLQNHSSVIVRASLAEAVGQYEDSERSLRLLEAALLSPDPVVKTGAIRGLGRMKSNEREHIMLSYIHKENPPLDKLVEIYTSLGRISSGEKKDIAIKNLINIAERGHSSMHVRALANVSNIAPDDKRVTLTLRKKLKKLDSETEVNLAIQHLSANKDKWLMAKLPAILNAKSVLLRKNAVKGLVFSCHPKRWQLLRRRIRVEKKPEVILALLNAPKMLLGKPAIDFLQEVIEKKKLSAKLLSIANENLDFANKNIKNSMCHSRSK